MPVFPNAPYDMDTFNQQAKDFVAKAKAAGKSNTAISNTLKFMYQMTIANIEAKQAKEMTPYQSASIDLEQQKLDKTAPNTEVIEVNGTKKLINKSTGQVIQDYSAGGNGILSQIEAGGPAAGSSASPDFESALQEFSKTKTSADVANNALKTIGSAGQKPSFAEGWLGTPKSTDVSLTGLKLDQNILNQQTPNPAQLTNVGQTQSPFRLLPGFAIQ